MFLAEDASGIVREVKVQVESVEWHPMGALRRRTTSVT
jgi:hypothetical protein